MECPDSRLYMNLFFEEIGFENDPIFLYFVNTIRVQFFEKIMIHKISNVQGTFAAKFLNGSRIDMAYNEIQGGLIRKSERFQVSTFWKDIAHFNMLVFQGTLFM